MPEITFIVDELRGAILVEAGQAFRTDADHRLRSVLGEGQEIGCARPIEIIVPPINFSEQKSGDGCVRIAGYYHNSLMEGPGRRSSVLFQFCPLNCKGCYVPELHSKEAGVSVSAGKLAELLLNSEYERDGITILGGEPFAQNTGLLALIRELREKGCPHIVCYSGYTLEVLREKAVKESPIGEVLGEIDILIDGAYVESLSGSASLWTGSGNQRVIDMRMTREQNEIVLYS